MSSPDRTSPAPRVAVARELLRALGGMALLPGRTAVYLARRHTLQAELLEDLRHPPEADPVPALPAPPARPLKIFLSCAEASGELHARSLVRALRARLAQLGAPPPRLFGLGGARLEAEGVELVANPVERAAMGFSAVLGALPFYLRLMTAAAECLARERPDVFVPVDSPALHVPLARIARRNGVPCVHFVTPQYWGWAPWRVGGYRMAVDRALTILPFEPPWFRRRRVPVAHVGHPLLDALRDVPTTRPPAAGPLVILPGSRESVIRKNLPWMLRTLVGLRAELGPLECILPHDRVELAPLLAGILEEEGASDWVELAPGELHAALPRARAALSVSGTVLLDLLHHRLPTVVLYRLSSARQTWLSRNLLTAPWFASINLLAGREVCPEFSFHGEGPKDAVRAALTRCLTDEAWRAECTRGLDRAALRLGPPGAAERAADWALDRALDRALTGKTAP